MFSADRILHILRVDIYGGIMFGMLMLDFYSIDSYSCLSPLLRRLIFVMTLPRVRRVRKLCEWLSLERKSISLISRAAYTFSRTPIRVYEQFHYRKDCPTPISKLNSTTVCKIRQCAFNGNIKYRVNLD